MEDTPPPDDGQGKGHLSRLGSTNSWVMISEQGSGAPSRQQSSASGDIATVFKSDASTGEGGGGGEGMTEKSIPQQEAQVPAVAAAAAAVAPIFASSASAAEMANPPTATTFADTLSSWAPPWVDHARLVTVSQAVPGHLPEMSERAQEWVDEYLAPGSHMAARDRRALKHIRKRGIPASCRMAVWMRACGCKIGPARKAYSEVHFAQFGEPPPPPPPLATSAGNSYPPPTKPLSAEALKELPNFGYTGDFSRFCLLPDGVTRVQRVLCCLALTAPGRNYCPELPVFVAICLHFSDEACTYALAARLLQAPSPFLETRLESWLRLGALDALAKRVLRREYNALVGVTLSQRANARLGREDSGANDRLTLPLPLDSQHPLAGCVVSLVTEHLAFWPLVRFFDYFITNGKKSFFRYGLALISRWHAATPKTVRAAGEAWIALRGGLDQSLPNGGSDSVGSLSRAQEDSIVETGSRATVKRDVAVDSFGRQPKGMLLSKVGTAPMRLFKGTKMSLNKLAGAAGLRRRSIDRSVMPLRPPAGGEINSVLKAFAVTEFDGNALAMTAHRFRNLYRSDIRALMASSYRQAAAALRSGSRGYAGVGESLSAELRAAGGSGSGVAGAGAGSRISMAPRADNIAASTIIAPELWDRIWNAVPLRHRMRQPNLVFSTTNDGYSLTTLFSRCEDLAPTILAVRTAGGAVFGAYVSVAWSQRRSSKGYFGNGETFVFSLLPEVAIYPWVGCRDGPVGSTPESEGEEEEEEVEEEAQKAGSGASLSAEERMASTTSERSAAPSFFLTGDHDHLSVGGGRVVGTGATGHAIDLTRDLKACCSAACTTFGNPPLATAEEELSFSCAAVEVWELIVSY